MLGQLPAVHCAARVHALSGCDYATRSFQVCATAGGLRCRVGNCDLPAAAGADGVVTCRLTSRDLWPGAANCGDEADMADDFVTQPAKARAARAVGESLVAANDGGDGGDADRKVDEIESGRRAGESRSEYLKREFSALKPFAIISLSYLLFTTTDGAVRARVSTAPLYCCSAVCYALRAKV